VKLLHRDRQRDRQRWRGVVHLEQPRRICCSCFCVPREGKCIVVEEEEVSRLLRRKRTEEEKESTNQLEKQITKQKFLEFFVTV
jgi:hypothetical protein